MNNVTKLAEVKRDSGLAFDAHGLAGEPAYPLGQEPWRDGKTDDGEQDSDDALAWT